VPDECTRTRRPSLLSTTENGASKGCMLCGQEMLGKMWLAYAANTAGSLCLRAFEHVWWG
jgi:hypothetical protein